MGQGSVQKHMLTDRIQQSWTQPLFIQMTCLCIACLVQCSECLSVAEVCLALALLAASNTNPWVLNNDTPTSKMVKSLWRNRTLIKIPQTSMWHSVCLFLPKKASEAGCPLRQMNWPLDFLPHVWHFAAVSQSCLVFLHGMIYKISSTMQCATEGAEPLWLHAEQCVLCIAASGRAAKVLQQYHPGWCAIWWTRAQLNSQPQCPRMIANWNYFSGNDPFTSFPSVHTQCCLSATTAAVTVMVLLQISFRLICVEVCIKHTYHTQLEAAQLSTIGQMRLFRHLANTLLVYICEILFDNALLVLVLWTLKALHSFSSSDNLLRGIQGKDTCDTCEVSNLLLDQGGTVEWRNSIHKWGYRHGRPRVRFSVDPVESPDVEKKSWENMGLSASWIKSWYAHLHREQGDSRKHNARSDWQKISLADLTLKMKACICQLSYAADASSQTPCTQVYIPLLWSGKPTPARWQSSWSTEWPSYS